MKEPSRIKESNSWNQFLTTGKVEDYLSYASGRSQKTDWVGDSPHAGVYTGNRNHIETDACR